MKISETILKKTSVCGIKVRLPHTLGVCSNSLKCHRPIKPLWGEALHRGDASPSLCLGDADASLFFAALNGLKLKCSVDCSHLFRHLESSAKKILRLMTVMVIFQWNKWWLLFQGHRFFLNPRFKLQLIPIKRHFRSFDSKGTWLKTAVFPSSVLNLRGKLACS